LDHAGLERLYGRAMSSATRSAEDRGKEAGHGRGEVQPVLYQPTVPLTQM
jgi:hypothetical protein